MFIEMFKCLLKHSFKMHLARIAEKKNIPIALRVSAMVCAESDWASICAFCIYCRDIGLCLLIKIIYRDFWVIVVMFRETIR